MERDIYRNARITTARCEALALACAILAVVALISDASAVFCVVAGVAMALVAVMCDVSRRFATASSVLTLVAAVV